MKFIIVTPSYGQLDWLELCMRSVVDQELNDGDTVLHLVQDGGTEGFSEFADNITEKINQWVASDHYKLALHSEPDEGMYDAINKGISSTDGDVYAWLNSDEQYLPGTLRKVSRYFKNNPDTEVLFGDALMVDSALEPKCYRRIMKPMSWHTRLDHLHSLSCAMFFRSHVLLEPPLDPKWKIISDAIMVDEWIRNGVIMKASGELYGLYAITGQNLSWDEGRKHEMSAWHKIVCSPHKWWRLPVIIHHRFRRLLAGAYQPFEIETKIHSHDSKVRKHVAKRLNGLWPL